MNQILDKAAFEPFARSATDVLHALSTGRGGLSQDECRQRALRFGPNRLPRTRTRSGWSIFLDQFKSFLIGVLVVAALVSAVIGEHFDAIAILIILVLNAALGFIQEFRAERAMEALAAMATPQALVERDGRKHTVPAEDLVPGDIVFLEAGSVVPADLRLVESASLRIDEAPLTGESVGVEKDTAVLGARALLAERRNMAFLSTQVTHGCAIGVVTSTGMNTEVGHIAHLLQATETVRTPLQRRLDAFGRRIGVVALAVCGVIFLFGVARGDPWLEMLLVAVSLAVAAVPEALPAVVTVSLALGARKMAAANALVRKLSAVEALGSVTTICTDKTGTLTQNSMSVEELATIDLRQTVGDQFQVEPSSPFFELVQAGALCNDASLSVRNGEAGGHTTGDPTEIALLVLASKAGLQRAELEKRWPRRAELPFDSERKRMTTLHDSESGPVAFVKGALQSVLDRCRHFVTRAGIDAMTEAHARQIREIEEAMAARGLRVLALARRELAEIPVKPTAELIERDLRFLGLVGILDPPRPEARAAVAECHAAGIRPVMITGDHPVTARVIAERLGIWSQGDAVVNGRDLEDLSAAKLESLVSHATVFARVSPEHKLRIVQALQAGGELVAMTGDGVNDAPALKRAEIGVSMGVTGTDVAKEASAIVLLDDRFSTIVGAVREGRRIYDNIRRFLRYILTTNSAEIVVMFVAPLFGYPVPLLPIQILWINLVTDGLPGLALALEPAEKDVMTRPPRRPTESIFARGLGFHVVFFGLLLAGLSMAGLALGWHASADHAHFRTTVFTVLALGQMAHVLAVRSETLSFFQLGLASNPALIAAVLLTIALQIIALYVPAAAAALHTQPLPLAELAACAGLASLVFVGVEIEKAIRRRFSD